MVCRATYQKLFFYARTPMSNEQVEATNKTLMATLKKKEKKKKLDKKEVWVKFLPEVLWSYKTTTRTLSGKLLSL
jgi:hypothetical protein